MTKHLSIFFFLVFITGSCYYSSNNEIIEEGKDLYNNHKQTLEKIPPILDSIFLDFYDGFVSIVDKCMVDIITGELYFISHKLQGENSTKVLRSEYKEVLFLDSLKIKYDIEGYFKENSVVDGVFYFKYVDSESSDNFEFSYNTKNEQLIKRKVPLLQTVNRYNNGVYQLFSRDTLFIVRYK